VEQSIYEPPATQRQYQNNLEKATRSYEQALNNYELQAEQAEASVNDVLIELNRNKRQLDELRGFWKILPYTPRATAWSSIIENGAEINAA